MHDGGFLESKEVGSGPSVYRAPSLLSREVRPTLNVEANLLRPSPAALIFWGEKKVEPMGAKRQSVHVRDNSPEGRFELEIGGQIVIAEYRLGDGAIVFTRTHTPPALRGRGFASELIRDALLAARERGLKVQTTCAFVADYLKRHPEFLDLYAP
jgi:predicted GNAT family acetyltransferase